MNMGWGGEVMMEDGAEDEKDEEEGIGLRRHRNGSKLLRRWSGPSKIGRV